MEQGVTGKNQITHKMRKTLKGRRFSSLSLFFVNKKISTAESVEIAEKQSKIQKPKLIAS
jgi:hypothetical protein